MSGDTHFVTLGDVEIELRRHGAGRPLLLLAGEEMLEAEAPIVAQELRIRQGDLLAAFAKAPGGASVGTLRIQVARAGESGRGARPWTADDE